MFERAMLRIGAVSLVAGLVAAVVFEALHPSREDPNNNPLVFAEYAQSGDWITVHLGQLAAALLLIGGLVALCGSVGLGPAVAAAWARLAAVSAVAAAAAYGVLQVVDGVALKRAVDAWMAAPVDGKTAAFAAAQAVRWTEYGLNSLTFSLVGLTLVLVGVALLAGDRFPRWLGAWAVAAGLAYGVRGLVVAYRGFEANVSGLVALVLFGLWVLVMAVFMWRRSSKLTRDSMVPSDVGAAARGGTVGHGPATAPT
ncbi:MAG TPA: hypothetical protein VGQ92_24440 [Actinoplanes sp.]|jgi:hypothetical protein|nr:hypothetical protein [Actinoplanes sp.]